MEDTQEVIAGSEDEEEMPFLGLNGTCTLATAHPSLTCLSLKYRHGLGGSATRQSSLVSAFTTSNYQPGIRSSISKFTAGPSVIHDNPSRFTSLERGSMKDMDAETSIASITGAYTDFEGIPSSIADRAKTRQRPAKSAISASLEVIELTTDDEDDYFGVGKSKAKAKAKSKLKPKPKVKDSEKRDDMTSMPALPHGRNRTDEVQATAPPRPRPRPRPRVVPQVPTADASTNANAPRPLTSAPSSCVGPTSDVPIPTSPSRAPPHPMMSRLPLSDPPLPSISTAHSDDPKSRAPPIDFLSDGPLSSPSSLFSEVPLPKKRKRNVSDLDELDELAPSQDLPVRYLHGLYGLSPPRGLPPPPTFFAGSSSSSFGRDGEMAPAPVGIPFGDVPEPAPQPDMVDLTMLPPIIVPLPKAKKTKKKKVDLSMYDGSEGNKMIVLDEDDQDDDFNPAEEGSDKKKKGKAKTKDKDKGKDRPLKNNNKSRVTKDSPDVPEKGKLELEVLINSRPPSKAGTKPKERADKGKQKAAVSNKEIYKSSEFIDDSEDELHSFAAGPSGAIVYVSPVFAPPGANSIPSAPISPSRQVRPLPQGFPSPLSDLAAEMPKAGPSTAKHVKGVTKKRKSIIDSEAEDDDFTSKIENAVHVTPSVTKKKRRKTEDATNGDRPKGKSKSKKGNNIVLSDDEQDEDFPSEIDNAIRVTPSVTKNKRKTENTTNGDRSKSKSNSKVMTDDEQEDMDEMPHEATEDSAKSSKVIRSSKKPNHDDDEEEKEDKNDDVYSGLTHKEVAAREDVPKARKVINLHAVMASAVLTTYF